MATKILMMNPTKSMNSEEACDYLQLNPTTLYKLANAGKIPGRKVGNSWRFSKVGLERWLNGEEV